MNHMVPLLWAGVAGIALGTMFYGGLWWTIRKSVASPQPALWVFVSLLVRMGGALAGFYFVAGTHWELLVVCLVGFIVARGGVTWMTRLPKENVVDALQKAGHAS
jgi:F1F0 ATPase subunit 2